MLIEQQKPAGFFHSYRYNNTSSGAIGIRPNRLQILNPSCEDASGGFPNHPAVAVAEIMQGKIEKPRNKRRIERRCLLHGFEQL
jgi:hypothetical protein